jgi:hypothetical protein
MIGIDQTQDSRFSGAVWPQQSPFFAFLYCPVNILQSNFFIILYVTFINWKAMVKSGSVVGGKEKGGLPSQPEGSDTALPVLFPKYSSLVNTPFTRKLSSSSTCVIPCGKSACEVVRINCLPSEISLLIILSGLLWWRYPGQ